MSLPVWHDGLSIRGVCDIVELSGDDVIPVEHKPTLSRWHRSPAALQLAAQAMCLEEMWGRPVARGVIFARRDHRRHEIAIDDELRAATRRAITGTRQLIEHHRLPSPVRDARCDRCSLRPTCLDDEVAARSDIFAPAPEGTW